MRGVGAWWLVAVGGSRLQWLSPLAWCDVVDVTVGVVVRARAGDVVNRMGGGKAVTVHSKGPQRNRSVTMVRLVPFLIRGRWGPLCVCMAHAPPSNSH